MPRVGGHPGSGLDTCKSSFCDSSTTNGDVSLLSAEASLFQGLQLLCGGLDGNNGLQRRDTFRHGFQFVFLLLG